VGSHLDEGGGSCPRGCDRHALEVGVELEVLHRILVVTLHEADRRDLLTDHPEDPRAIWFSSVLITWIRRPSASSTAAL
jgi:hypothetical protein